MNLEEKLNHKFRVYSESIKSELKDSTSYTCIVKLESDVYDSITGLTIASSSHVRIKATEKLSAGKMVGMNANGEVCPVKLGDNVIGVVLDCVEVK